MPSPPNRRAASQKVTSVRVGAADVIAPPTPPLQTFEELDIPAPFRAAVEKELSAGEKILWLGRPSRNRQVHPKNTGITLMGLGAIAVGVTIAVAALFMKNAGPFPFVFAGVLTLIGLLCQLPRVVNPAKNCRHCYALTNRRALLVELSIWGKATANSYLPHQLLGLERRNHPEVAGAGDLIFEYVFAMAGNSFDARGGGLLQQGAGVGRSDVAQRVPRGFVLLDQARDVENLIRTTLLQELEKSLDEPKQRDTTFATAAFSVPCSCGLILEAPASLAGKSVKCPRCSAPVAFAPVDNGVAAAHGPCREDGIVPADLKAKALADLDPNERVVWIARPVAALLFLRSSLWLGAAGIAVLFALMWLLVALASTRAVETAAVKTVVVGKQKGKTVAVSVPAQEVAPAAPNLLPPGGLFLLALSFGAVPFVRYYFARRTCYALTNRRALVYREGLLGTTRESYPPVEVAGMRLSNSWLMGGKGDVIFRSVTVIRSWRSQGKFKQQATTTHYGFLGIAHLQEVGALVRETLIDRFVDRLTQASSSRQA